MALTAEHPGSAVAPSGTLLADRAYVELRDRIVGLTIPPGAPINEDALGRELEMGRTPVREAIKRLALENLVTVFPRRGTFAAEINITDLADISDVRVQLDGHAAYRAAERLTPPQREELQELLAAVEGDESEHDATRLMAHDTQVHRFVYRCASNPYLQEIADRYLNLSLRIWHLALDRIPHPYACVREHPDLLIAIRDVQPERARAIMAEHVTNFEREIRSVL